MFKEIGDLKVHTRHGAMEVPSFSCTGGKCASSLGRRWSHYWPGVQGIRLRCEGSRRNGETTRPQPTHDLWVEDLYGFMGAFGIKKAAVAGWSMGGAIGLSFAIKYPDMLSHLLLLGAGNSLVPFTDRSMWEERRRLKEAGYREKRS